jgi:hypothetical protein
LVEITSNERLLEICACLLPDLLAATGDLIQSEVLKHSNDAGHNPARLPRTTVGRLSQRHGRTARLAALRLGTAQPQLAA